MNKAQKEFIKEVAGRLIGGYIEAIEQDDISYADDNWITNPEHWGFDLEDGKKLLSLIGLSDTEVETEIDAIRYELGEDEPEENEWDDEDDDEFTEMSE